MIEKEMTESEYYNWVEIWSCEMAAALVNAKMNTVEIEKVLRDYIHKAYVSNLSSGELVDFFCVSSDSVIDRIMGISELDKDIIIKLFDKNNSEIFPRYFKC